MREYSIAKIAGDGIGPEVIREGVKVLEAAAAAEGFRLRYTDYPYGAEYYLKTGRVLPGSGFAELKDHDAIYFGAVGDPRVKPGVMSAMVRPFFPLTSASWALTLSNRSLWKE